MSLYQYNVETLLINVAGKSEMLILNKLVKCLLTMYLICFPTICLFCIFNTIPSCGNSFIHFFYGYVQALKALG